MDEQGHSQRTIRKDDAISLVAALTQADVTEESTLWTSFAEATTVEVFCRNWLALQ